MKKSLLFAIFCFFILSESFCFDIDEELAIPLCPAIIEQTNDVVDHEVHTYSGFTLCYRENYEEAEWVAYVLTKEELVAVSDRTDDFRVDPSISTGSADLNDYKKSGFDRGHLAPAADMEWSERSTRESFLMSNMTPQVPSFNRGMWKTLEDMVRKWAYKFGAVYVVTGPILEKPETEYPFIGNNKVVVPEYFYKTMLSKTEKGNYIAIAFILPNKKCEGKVWDYVVSIDTLENRTGLDFFSKLDDDIENILEEASLVEDWQ